jgi:two-component system LytT family response regulator
MKLKAIIADDEDFARQTLISMIENFAPEVEVVGEASDLEQLKILILQKKPQLLFLDIAMKGENGFQIFQEFEEREFEVVVTSAYDEYALKSFDFGIADYLLKPLSPSAIKRAVARVEKILALQNEEGEMIQLYTSDGIKTIQIREIVRLYAERNYSWICLSSGEKILSSKNLGFFEEALLGKGFLRIHHSHLVALNRIHLNQKSQGMIVLEDGVSIPVSRDKRKLIPDIALKV